MAKLRWEEDKDISAPRTLVLKPAGAKGPLPAIFLFHGAKDKETDWLRKDVGDLRRILADHCSCPMLVVLPYMGDASPEKPLEDAAARYAAAWKALVDKANPAKHGILGISRGAWQALALALKPPKPIATPADVLGLLSGMFQDNYLPQVSDYAGKSPKDLARRMRLYFHYCGGAPSRIVGGKKRGGDALFLPFNRALAAEAGGMIEVEKDGMHNWNFWRPQLERFFEELSAVWRTSRA